MSKPSGSCRSLRSTSASSLLASSVDTVVGAAMRCEQRSQPNANIMKPTNWNRLNCIINLFRRVRLGGRVVTKRCISENASAKADPTEIQWRFASLYGLEPALLDNEYV